MARRRFPVRCPTSALRRWFNRNVDDLFVDAEGRARLIPFTDRAPIPRFLSWAMAHLSSHGQQGQDTTFHTLLLGDMRGVIAAFLHRCLCCRYDHQEKLIP